MELTQEQLKGIGKRFYAGEPLEDEFKRIRLLLTDNCPIQLPTVVIFSESQRYRLIRSTSMTTTRQAMNGMAYCTGPL